MNYKKTNLNDFTKIGNKLKQIRTKETNLTQEQLARKCELTVKTISDIECCKVKDIRGTTLDKICKALNVRIEDILY